MIKALTAPSLLLLGVLAFTQGRAADDKTVSATYTDSPIVIDGNLDELQWNQVEPAANFIQKEPLQGEPATEPTEVRLLYDDENLYVGIFCFDSIGEDSIVVSDIRRDYSDGENDHFAIVLDTFDNDRTGFLFATNPYGAKRDAQISLQGNPNFDWDAIWDVKTKITPRGWQAEIAIPFRTLRFREMPDQTWGINFVRRIRRKNEDAHWSPVPRPYRLSRMDFAGTLEGLSGIHQGRNLYLKPYLSTPLTRREGDDVDFIPELGLDVKYGVTPGLTLDLTVNTEFAQVEADEQQINLTRFSLFFPEKREFFLENASIFQFGKGGRGFGPGAGGDLIPFFTRRIGISGGRLVPILGGARLTGRAGSYSLGVLSMQTDEFEEVPSTNFSVVRVRRDIFGNSDLGGLLVNKQETDGRFNRTYGADLNLRYFNNLDINTSLLKTDATAVDNQEMAGTFSVTWSDPRFDMEARYLDIEENFNPEVGFVPRTGIRKSRGKFTYKPRPGERIPWIRDFKPSVSVDHITDQENELETRFLNTELTILFQDSSSLRFRRTAIFERLQEPFQIRPDQAIPVGDYQFQAYSALFSGDRSRMFSGAVGLEKGNFFDGDQELYFLGFLFQPGHRLSAEPSWNYGQFDLPSGEFTTSLFRTRFQYSFSTTMFLNALIQYNNTLGEISSNIRFNWIYQPLSDFFLVYNERRSTTGEVRERALIAKFTYVFDF